MHDMLARPFARPRFARLVRLDRPRSAAAARLLSVVVLTTLLLLVQAGCQSPGAEADDDSTRALPILAKGHGDAPSLDQPEVFLVNDPTQLQSRGLEPYADMVNLDRQTLIVLALGQRPTGGYSARITGAQTDDEYVYVQGVARRPAEDAPVTMAITHPFYMAVVPKVRGEVRAEIDSIIGGEAFSEVSIDVDRHHGEAEATSEPTAEQGASEEAMESKPSKTSDGGDESAAEAVDAPQQAESGLVDDANVEYVDPIELQ